MLKKNIETFINCDKSEKDATTVLFGAPFDSTTSYRPGTRFGSAAIRHESYGIESYSPYLDKDLSDISVLDSGDLELCIGDAKKALKRIESHVNTIFKAGKRPFMLGGEHLVTLAAVRAAQKKRPDLCVVHFDAHSDLRDDYLGAKLSHACVLRRCWEILGDGRIFQFGIRSGDKEEFKWGESHVFTQRFNFSGLEKILTDLQCKPIYFTLDLDVVEPGVLPGTGTPEPGGVSFEELRKAVTLVCQRSNVVACDVCELNPHYDQSGISTVVACKIVREMLLSLR